MTTTLGESIVLQHVEVITVFAIVVSDGQVPLSFFAYRTPFSDFTYHRTVVCAFIGGNRAHIHTLKFLFHGQGEILKILHDQHFITTRFGAQMGGTPHSVFVLQIKDLRMNLKKF
jgi:hypothetical protein